MVFIKRTENEKGLREANFLKIMLFIQDWNDALSRVLRRLTAKCKNKDKIW